MDKKPQIAFIPLFIAAAAACGLLTVCFAEKWVAHVLLAVCVVSFSIGLSIYSTLSTRLDRRLKVNSINTISLIDSYPFAIFLNHFIMTFLHYIKECPKKIWSSSIFSS